MKQLAVEWLIQEHFGGIENCTPHFRYNIEKALELEKKNMIDFADKYSDELIAGSPKIPKQYYDDYMNET